MSATPRGPRRFGAPACGLFVVALLALALAAPAARAAFVGLLNIDFGEAPPTSPDGKFSVEFVECLASCGSAPVALINDDLHENITPDDAADIVKEYAAS